MAIRLRAEAWLRIPRGGRDGGPFPRGQGLVHPCRGSLECARLPSVCRSLRQVQGGRTARRRPGFLLVHRLRDPFGGGRGRDIPGKRMVPQEAQGRRDARSGRPAHEMGEALVEAFHDRPARKTGWVSGRDYRAGHNGEDPRARVS